jgi:hypothetical protein
MPLSKKNVYWRDVPKNACVVDRGHAFIMKVGRKQATIFWEGREAAKAQADLSRRAKRGCKKGRR